MADLFPLTLFPEGGLSQSVITTVWVGVFVVAFFNLRFGWTLSGLVIPGYLVPLMLARPWSAVIVLIEGILTYWLVWLFSEYLSKFGKWSSLFGRDRFFAMVVGSLAVRIILDGWILPEVGRILNSELGIAFDYTNNLRSFGLIITALIANYFWKPGLKKGLFSILATTGITLLLVRYVLIEFTNFNIGRLEYMFEDLGAFFLASPKAYIIIVITSFIASRMNLEYGWEYSGIMIPSLLALQWYQPYKLISTIVEAIVVLGIAKLVLKLPLFREKTIEGARKILLFFNIAFIYKFILGYILLWTAPHFRITDAYGFGYLLSAMIAIKMHDRLFFPQMVRSLFQTSLVAVIMASGIGIGLIYLSNWMTPAPAATFYKVIRPGKIEASLMETIRREKLSLYKKRSPESVRIPSPTELDHFEKGLTHLLNYILYGNSPDELDKAVLFFSNVSYRLDRTKDGYFLLREAEAPKGSGVFAFKIKSELTDPVIEIPAPLDENSVLEAGTYLFRELNGSCLAIAGSSRKTNEDGSSDVLSNPYTFFHVFHRVTGLDNTIQVRTTNAESNRYMSYYTHQPDPEQFIPSLWVKGRIPPGLSLSNLKNLLKNYSVYWEGFKQKNIQRQKSNSGFAELFLDRRTARRLNIRSLNISRTVDDGAVRDFQSVENYLRQQLMETRGKIAEKGSNLYKPFTIEELMYTEQEVLLPLLELIKKRFKEGELTSEGAEELRVINTAASIIGYRIDLFRNKTTGTDYLVMEENDSAAQRRFTGTYIFRTGMANGFIVQVPRPLFDRNSFEYGVYLYENLGASVLAISGAHPMANRNLSADVLLVQNKTALFNLVTQVVMREARNIPMMAVACRAFSYKPYRESPGADAFLATGDWSSEPARLSLNGRLLMEKLEADGLEVLPVHGQEATMGFEVGVSPTYNYLPLTQDKEFAVLWLSPELRRYYRMDNSKRTENTQFEFLGIETRTVDLFDFLKEQLKRIPAQYKAPLYTNGNPVPDSIRDNMTLYHIHSDIILLENLLRDNSGYTVSRLIDTDSQQSFLVFLPKGNGFPIVVNLFPRNEEWRYIKERTPDRETVKRFIDSHTAWLVFKEEE